MLEIDHLTVAYGDAVAVWDVSLVMGERELVTVVGPNGAGKTTLINALAGLLPIRAGTLRFDGVAPPRGDGVAVLRGAQTVAQDRAPAARAYVLEEGRIVAEGAARELAQDARIREAYLGQQC